MAEIFCNPDVHQECSKLEADLLKMVEVSE